MNKNHDAKGRFTYAVGKAAGTARSLAAKQASRNSTDSNKGDRTRGKLQQSFANRVSKQIQRGTGTMNGAGKLTGVSKREMNAGMKVATSMQKAYGDSKKMASAAKTAKPYRLAAATAKARTAAKTTPTPAFRKEAAGQIRTLRAAAKDAKAQGFSKHALTLKKQAKNVLYNARAKSGKMGGYFFS
jgi:hypothetical protein